jgi:hypothetical protein
MSEKEMLMSESIYDEVDRKDSNHILLVELIHLLSSCIQIESNKLKNISINEEIGLIGEPFQNLTITIRKLASISGKNEPVIIKAKPNTISNSNDEEIDFEVHFSDISIDKIALRNMIDRVGDRMNYLEGLMYNAFRVFHKAKIFCIFLKIDNEIPNIYSNLRVAIQILSQYNKSINSYEPLRIILDGNETEINIIKNEIDQPDINLTIISVLNNIPYRIMCNLVKEIKGWINSSDNSTGSHRYASVYNAISSTKGLGSRLIPSPIEVNNIKWLLLESGEKKLTKPKTQIALLLNEVTESTLQQINYINCLYGTDYHQISSIEILQRIEKILYILNSIGNRSKKEIIREEIINNLQSRMDSVPDSTYDAVDLQDGILITNVSNKMAVSISDNTIIRYIKYFKNRSVTRRKLQSLNKTNTYFNKLDIEIIAREFDISPVDAKKIIKLLTNCFDENGHFIKNKFEKQLIEFSKFQNDSFKILWYFLKEPLNREDRLAFLNSLQLLFRKLKTPENAIKILLEDFLSNVKIVTLSDRNAIILANLLLRRYNKEIDIDIEITPEEVFLVKNGLHRDVADKVVFYLDEYKEYFIEKLKNIHRKIYHSLDNIADDSDKMTIKFLLSLEREIHIFLGILGGDLSRSILRGALNTYGNSNNALYRIAKSDRFRQSLIQHLKVLFRALGRAGSKSDMPIIKNIIDEKVSFLSLSNESRYSMLVEKAMEYGYRSIQDLSVDN